MSRPVSVHIERLVLHGVRPADRHGVSEALAAELSRLLAQQGAPAHLAGPGAFERMSPRPIRLPAGSSPRRLGQRLAAALYGALEQPR
jgi:hypothetical protein